MNRHNRLNGRREKAQIFLYEITFYLELVVAALVIIMIIGMIVGTVIELFQEPGKLTDTARFTDMLGIVLNVVVGIEFLKMLCRHNMDSVIEVLLFALARQLIVSQHSTLEGLLCVVAVAVLFVVRKYLFVPVLDKIKEEK